MATVGRIAPRQAQSLSREYVEAGWFRQDPNLSLIFSADAGACTVGGAMALARYTREYRRRFFESAEIVDKVAFSVRVDDDFWIYANFHRLADSGPFDSEDFDALVRHGPVLAACLVRDRELMAGARRLDAGATVFDVLTPREKDVCAAILAGLTLGGVAQSLGISLNTVLTLRRRAYGRLGIATERELVRLSLRPD